MRTKLLVIALALVIVFSFSLPGPNRKMEFSQRVNCPPLKITQEIFGLKS